MKIKDILNKINDYGLFIRIINEDDCVIFEGKKNDPTIVSDTILKNTTIKNINANYKNAKRYLIIEI